MAAFETFECQTICSAHLWSASSSSYLIVSYFRGSCFRNGNPMLVARQYCGNKTKYSANLVVVGVSPAIGSIFPSCGKVELLTSPSLPLDLLARGKR